MTTREWIVVGAVSCAIISAAYLVQTMSFAGSRGMSAGVRRWTAAPSAPQRAMLLPRPTTMHATVQVGRLSRQSKRLQTRAQVNKR